MERSSSELKSDVPEPVEREFFALPGMDALWAALMAVFTALVCYLVWAPPADTALEAALGRVLFGAAAIFGVSATTRILMRLKDRRPVLSLSQDGILDRGALGRPVFIPWDQIVAIRPSPRGTSILEIEVLDPPALQLSWVRRLRQRLISQTGVADVLIGVGGLDAPSELVISMAHAWNESRLLSEARALGALPDPDSGMAVDGEGLTE